MSIERLFGDYDGDITILCDECGDGFEADTGDFHAAIRDFKAQGGVVSREGDDWRHFCADCAADDVFSK